MANEIRATATLTITANGFTITGNTTDTVSMTGSNYKGEIFTISSSYVALPTGSCGDIRYLYITNQSTASVNVAVNSTSQSFATLRDWDTMLLPLPATVGTVWVKSDAHSTDIQYVLVES